MSNFAPAVPFLGTPGKRYKMFSGVMHNVGANVWELYDDVGHHYMNVSSVSANNEKLTVNTGLTGKIVGFQCGVSYVAAQAGISVGASVAANTVYMYLVQEAQIYDAYIYYSGSAWVIGYQYGGGNFAVSGFNGGTGELTLTHENTGEFTVIATPSRTVYGIVALAGSGTSTTIKFVDRATGTVATTEDADMRFYVQRTKKRTNLDPANVTSAVWFHGIVEL